MPKECLSLKDWLKCEVERLGGAGEIDLATGAWLAQGPRPKVWESLVLLAIIEGEIDELLLLVDKEDMKAEALEVKSALGEIDLQDYALNRKQDVRLPPRFRKRLDIYYGFWCEAQGGYELGQRRWNILRLMRGFTGDITDVYRAAGVDAGRWDAFMAGELNALSIEQASDAWRFLYSKDRAAGNSAAATS